MQVLGRVWMRLHEAGVRAAVMGGIAVSAWRHIRATHDVDLLVELDEDQLPETLGVLAKGGFYCRRLPPILTIDEARIIQLLHDVPDTYVEIRVDLLLADTPAGDPRRADLEEMLQAARAMMVVIGGAQS